jgi:hypothetical protein
VKVSEYLYIHIYIYACMYECMSSTAPCHTRPHDACYSTSDEMTRCAYVSTRLPASEPARQSANPFLFCSSTRSHFRLTCSPCSPNRCGQTHPILSHPLPCRSSPNQSIRELQMDSNIDIDLNFDLNMTRPCFATICAWQDR